MEILQNFPMELLKKVRWMNYVTHPRPGGGIDKIPINPNTLYTASACTPSALVSFEKAAEQVGKETVVKLNTGEYVEKTIAGVGYVFADDGIVGIDLDHCIHDGKVDSWAQKWVDELNSYTELSFSRDGLHVLGMASLGGRKGIKTDSIEIYDNKRFFVVTGLPYGSVKPLREAQEVVDRLYAELSGDKASAEQMAIEDLSAPPQEKSVQTADSEQAATKTPTPTAHAALPHVTNSEAKNYFEIGLEKDSKFRSLWDGNRPHRNESVDDQALMAKLAYWCNRDPEQMREKFLSSPHYAQKDAAHKDKAERNDYLRRTVAKALSLSNATAQDDDEKYRENHKFVGERMVRMYGNGVNADKTDTENCVKQADSEKTATENSVLSLFRPVSNFQEMKAEWLVPYLIPAGQITVFASAGGIGKTTVMCQLAAAISSGTACLLDQSDQVKRAPGKVLFLTTEDSISKKLKSKFRRMGANQENIIAPDPSLDKDGLLRGLKFGTPALADAIRSIRPSLCIFDPIQGYVPAEVNMGARNAMRDCLATLAALGEETGCTFIIVCHSNKRRGASGRDRISDSSDIWDIARSVLMAGFTQDEGVRYISNEKNNYALRQNTILFEINEGLPVKTGTTTKRDADFVMEAFHAQKEGKRPNEELLKALRESAVAGDSVRFSYEDFRAKYGESIFGESQPLRALRRVKPILDKEGIVLGLEENFRGHGKTCNGFIIETDVPF